MSPATKIYLLLGVIALILILVISPLRAVAGGIFSHFLSPTVAKIFLTAMSWLWGIWKSIWRSHVMLLMHLIRPHSVIYPTLVKDDDRRL